MIGKIITVLSIITVSVDGSETNRNQQFAISQQNLHQRDPPISYKYTNLRKRRYKEDVVPEFGNTVYRKHSLIPMWLPSIQYAPLSHKMKPHKHQKQQQYENLVNKNTEHLEPRLMSEHYNVQKIKHNVGRNIEQPINHSLGKVESFIPQRTQPINPPKFVYYKTKAHNGIQPNNFINDGHKGDEVDESTSENYYNEHGYVSPTDYDTRAEPKQQSKSYTFKNLLAMEKPKQAYQNPRIHLNIARIYNVGKHPQEDQFPGILAPQNNKPKPSAHLRQIVLVPSTEPSTKRFVYPAKKSFFKTHVQIKDMYD